jgi:hypothetical protein
MRSNGKLGFGIALVAFCMATGALAQTSLDTDTLAIVELTKKEIIALSKFKSSIQLLEKQLKRVTTIEERKQLLNNQIDAILVVQACERDGITVTEAEINEKIKQYTAMLNNGVPMTDAQIQAQIAKEGLSYDEFKTNFRKNLLVEKYLFSKKGAEIEALRLDKMPDPSGAEIEAYYTQHKGEFLRPESVVVSLIVIPFSGKTDTEKAAARTMMQNIATLVGNDGNAFSTYLANGTIKGNPYQSAENVPIAKGDKNMAFAFGEAFINAVFKITVGNIQYVESERGAFVVRVSDKVPEKQLTLADPMGSVGGTSMNVRMFIIRKIKTERQASELDRIRKEVVDALRKVAKITVYESRLNF